MSWELNGRRGLPQFITPFASWKARLTSISSPIHLYMHPFHTSLHASHPYIHRVRTPLTSWHAAGGVRSTREEGNVDNAFRDDGGGISMVHRCGLKNLLMVKCESFRNLKATNYKKEPDQGQTNTGRGTFANLCFYDRHTS